MSLLGECNLDTDKPPEEDEDPMTPTSAGIFSEKSIHSMRSDPLSSQNHSVLGNPRSFNILKDIDYLDKDTNDMTDSSHKYNDQHSFVKQ